MLRQIGKGVVLITYLAMGGGQLSGCAVDGDPTIGDVDLAVASLDIDPVVFVGGCNPPFLTPEQASHFTDPMRAYFQSRGYPAEYLFSHVAEGPWCNSAIDSAQQISDAVDELLAATGRRRVDIVSHSINGSRLYLAQGGDRYVDDYVTMAGGNHGGVTAIAALEWQAIFGYPFYEGLKEMYPPYACEGETLAGAADIQFALNGCLTPTGRTVFEDETPGNVDYLAIRTTNDEQAIPEHTVCLNQEFIGDCSDPLNVQVNVPSDPTGPCPIPGGCPSHVAMVYHPSVIGLVFEHLTRRGDGDDEGDED